MYEIPALWRYCFQEVVILVKGISRQVIVVQGPKEELFDQAIFILKNDISCGKGVTDEALLKEAHRLINAGAAGKRNKPQLYPLFWAGVGALAMGTLWIVSALIFLA